MLPPLREATCEHKHMEPACSLSTPGDLNTGKSDITFHNISGGPVTDTIRTHFERNRGFRKGLSSIFHLKEQEKHAIVFDHNEIEDVIRILSNLDQTNGAYHISLVSPFFKEIGLDESKGDLGDHGQFSFYLDPSRRGKRLHITRFFDLAITVPSLVCWFPFHLLAVLAIRLTSKGKGIFRSERIGFEETKFTVLKYRTMAASSSDSAHREFVSSIYDKQTDSTLDQPNEVLKLQNDPRITPLGKVIRKLSIDEIPQLWNVLKGEMTLIGPRPCIDYEYEMMQYWQRRRFEVTPGLSGMWQVYGRSRCSIQQSHFLDSLFVYAQSTPLYLRLLAKTPLAVLSMKGAH